MRTKDIGSIWTEAEGRRVTVTRVDPGSGKPITYRLTPASSTVVTVTHEDFREIGIMIHTDVSKGRNARQVGGER